MIARGGEGSTFEVTGGPAHVAKILPQAADRARYGEDSPDAEREEYD
jgi:hypothetical protein